MVARVKLRTVPPPKKQTYAGKKRGQKALYMPQFAKAAEILCARGATNADLADAFGVSTVTINNWLCTHKDFAAAVQYGKAAVFDPKVERALAERALGYSVDTEEVKVLTTGRIVRVPIRKHFPPDTTACIFWLKNRNPKAWRDVWNHEHSGELKLNDLTSAQLLEEIRKEAAELGIVPEILMPKGVAPNGKGSNGSTKH